MLQEQSQSQAASILLTRVRIRKSSVLMDKPTASIHFLHDDSVCMCLCVVTFVVRVLTKSLKYIHACACMCVCLCLCVCLCECFFCVCECSRNLPNTSMHVRACGFFVCVCVCVCMCVCVCERLRNLSNTYIHTRSRHTRQDKQNTYAHTNMHACINCAGTHVGTHREPTHIYMHAYMDTLRRHKVGTHSSHTYIRT